MKKFLKKFLLLTTVFILYLQTGAYPAQAASPKIPKLKASVSGNTVTLTWNNVKGASGVQIFLYYKAYDKYKRIGTFASGKTNQLSLKGSYDKVYTYKIRSYIKKNGKATYSHSSKALQIKTAPSQPSITRIQRASGTSATVSWKRIKSAEGYQIMRATSLKGRYTRIGVVSGNTVFTYTDKKLNPDTTYYYKVRAYLRNSGTVVYSAYSTPETAVKPSERSVIVVGDSRTEMLQDLVGDSKITWICKSGMGYKWLKDTALQTINTHLKENSDLFLWLGVNDPDNISSYIRLLNQEIPIWKERGAKIHILAVGPVQNDPYVTNKEIQNFNLKMKSQVVSADFLDLYTWLKKQGYKTTDGTHYDNATSLKIYNYILNAL